MDKHLRGHKPFGCFQCQFVCENEKDLKDHLMEHSHSTTSSQGCKTADHKPQVCERPKRKLKSSPALLPGEETEEETKRQKGNRKRVRKAVESNTALSLDSETLPSKEYLAEGSEHIYRTHTCPKCRRCFKMRSHLQEHLHLHFPDPSLQCPTCKRYFTSKSKLRIHQLREAGEKLHQCHMCAYSAVEKNAIRRHLASVHAAENSQSFPCLTCGESFLQSRALKAHMKTHIVPSDSRPMSCFQEGCSFQSSSHKDLLKHITEEHGVRAVECQHHACGAVFRSESDMRAHYRTHLAYHCSQCDFSCSNKALFLQHQRQGHPGSDKLCCNFCSFVTFNPVEFEQHVGHLHASEKIHQCSQCSFVTSHKRGLKRHMLMHSGEKPHKCSLCDFRCRDESYLSKHMLTHSENKNFMCAECGYVTKWKHYLTVHMRKHAGDLRYQCDQCSYRCHRMDQLNSHKLRHQAKSLMCEICAYACKRKYELRNHMLAKHSEEEKQASVYKCKYCTYTTCYRQALQNHENCKHTKLKEYRCALCFYSSFSSISLFLHKRKTHGYVPGDKAWLDNYAAKEKERNSTELLKDFYHKLSGGHEQSEGPSSSLIRQPDVPGSEDHCAEKDPVDVFEVPNEGISDVPTSINSPEEYCTLVLTTLSSADYQEEEIKQTPSSPSLNPAHVSTSSSERGNVETDDGECQDDNDESPLVEPEDDQIQTPELENDDRTITSSLLTEDGHPSEPEIHLKAMKEHDKDQAEAMFLEGRVQMLVVPAEKVFSCTKCSYVTSKETALKYHHQAACRGRMKGHKCQACGAQFKQKRGFQSHLAKKCPAVQRKTRKFVGVSNTRLTPEDESGAGQGGSKELGECTDQAEPLSPHTGISSESNDQVCQEESGVTAHSSSCNLHDASTSRESRHRRGAERKSAPLSSPLTELDGKYKCKLCSFSSVKLATVERHVTRCTKVRKKQNQEGERSVKGFVEKCDDRAGKGSELDSHRKKGSCERLQGLHKGAHPYCCRYCPYSTSRHYRLEEHESLHTGIGRQSCNICDKTFGTVTKLRQHKIRIHDKQPSHFCSLCDFSSYTQDDVRRHNLRCHTGELHHSCTHCDAQFSSEVALRNHCKRVHKLQACFSCKQCDHTCSSEATLKSHQESRHPQVKCPTCQEVFETKESLETHQKTHLAHQCQLCPFAAKTKQLLAQHLLTEHEEGSPENKPLKCGACEFSCRHQLVLEQHLRSHGGKRLYKCTDCEYSTRNKQKITWHIRIHTGEKPYSCEQCSYSCTDPSRLKLHMRVHQEEKKYLCPECGYKCKWATQLKYHMTRHTGDKPYACDECKYRTNRADALRAHRDTQHCDLRPFVCEKCGKAFKTSFVLKTHQRQHSSDRPYTCGLCNKAFRWPAGLRHHYLSHTKQQPFCCRHCSYRAKQKFQVVKHLKRHHPEVSAEQGVLKDAEAVSLTLKEALQGRQEETEMEEEEEERVDMEQEDVEDVQREEDVRSNPNT